MARSLAFLLPAALVAVANAGPTALRAEDAPVFAVTLASGEVVRGPLAALASDWSVRVGTGAKIPGGEVIRVRRVGVSLPPLPSEEGLILANGDRLPVGAAPRLDGERLLFTHPDLAGGAETAVPLAAVSVYWRAPPDRTAGPERLRRRLTAGKRARDFVLLRNGDVLEGTLTALDARAVEVEADRKTRSARVHQVAAVALSTDLADRLTPKGVHARLVLTATDRSPGGRLTLVSADCEGATLRGKTALGVLVRVPLERVAALDLFGGRAVALPELEPARYEYYPYLDEKWGWSAGATVTGLDLRLGGSAYDRGVGMHSHSRLTWKLAGGFTRFEALVGLDDREGRRGAVRVRVLADGKPAEGGVVESLTGEGGPKPVGVRLGGARELTLEVERGAGGPVGDVVDWVDAVLVR